MDVKTAFLHGSLDEEIFMAQSEGFIERGSEDKVCLLKELVWPQAISKVMISKI